MSEGRAYIHQAEANGDIYISEEVLAQIAGAATLEIEGVAGLAGGNLGEQVMGKKNYAKGVTVLRDEESLVINLSILIQYGFPVPDIARKVQEAVMANMEATSGLKVRAVNIRVAGVIFQKGSK